MKKNNALFALLSFLILIISGVSVQEILPRPEQPFQGHIGLTVKDSVKDFPEQIAAPDNAPNILLILTDDVGFGASSTRMLARTSSNAFPTCSAPKFSIALFSSGKMPSNDAVVFQTSSAVNSNC